MLEWICESCIYYPPSSCDGKPCCTCDPDEPAMNCYQKKDALTMPECKWCWDGICVNADCPMRADFCPVPDIPGVCRFEEREDTNEQS